MILIYLNKHLIHEREQGMRNSLEKIIWGIVFVVFGGVLAMRALGILEFDLFFPGWWTLFIIVPSTIGLISGKEIASNIAGIAIGIMLLMTQIGVIDWQEFVKLLIAVVLVKIGISFIFPGKKHQSKAYKKYYRNEKDYNNVNYNHDDSQRASTGDTYTYEQDATKEATFAGNTENTGNTTKESTYNHENRNFYGGKNVYTSNQQRYRSNSGFRQYTGFFSVSKDQYIDEVFPGAVVTAILGGVELDLRNAVFLNDTIIDITCIMGGVDIFVPANVKVVVNCTPILGGVECYVKNSYNQDQNQHTLFIKGTCLMGGVEIK